MNPEDVCCGSNFNEKPPVKPDVKHMQTMLKALHPRDERLYVSKKEDEGSIVFRIA